MPTLLVITAIFIVILVFSLKKVFVIGSTLVLLNCMTLITGRRRCSHRDEVGVFLKLQKKR